GERWWTVAEIAGERLLLHAMSTDGPQPYGLVALHSRTGQVAWEAFQYRFLALTANGIAVQHRNVSGRVPFLLDVLSGGVITAATHEEIIPMPVSVTLPLVYTQPPPAWLSAYPVE